MMTKLLWSVALLVPIGLSAVAVDYSHDTNESICPGKIQCPLTGEEVCKDKCPLIDADRSDCPGKVECPLTGELVCRDKCPLNSKDAEVSIKADSDLPPCCRKKK